MTYSGSYHSNNELMILGGGVAGLTASIVANAPVYEANEVAGGACLSDFCDGFTFDRGIHVLQTENRYILDLLSSSGVKFNTHKRKAFIHAFGKNTAYPFQVNSTNLPLLRRVKCVFDFLNRYSNPSPENYAEWIYRSVGRGFADTFLIPYSEKFWGLHPKDMSFEWTDNRIPQSDTWSVIRGAFFSKDPGVGSNAVFKYPQGPRGYGEVAAALASIAGHRLHTGQKATCLNLNERRITFNDSIDLDYQIMINTIPLPELIRIAIEVPEEVSCAVKSLKYNSIMVVNIGIDRANISEKHWIHFPEKEISFFRLSFPHNFSDNLTPNGMSSISCEVSYPPGRPPEKEEILKKVTTDLLRVGILKIDDKIIVRHVRDIPYGYCIFNRQREEALKIINSWLAKGGILPCGRYGLWAYFWSHEAILSGDEVARVALKKIDKGHVNWPPF